MKNYLLTILCLALFATGLHAQTDKEPIIRPALMAGVNGTQVDGDQIGGFHKIGLNVGASAFIRLPSNFSLSFEILYSQKGANSSVAEIQSTNHERNIKLDYADVPIMVNFHDKNGAIFSLGLIVNNLVRSKELTDGNEESFTYRSRALEAAGGFTFLFAKHFGANVRYSYSLTDIVKTRGISNLRDDSRRNNVATIRLMYFFGKPVIEPQEKQK